MPLAVMIVDDEPLARERVRSLLETESDIEVTAECADGPSALAAYGERRPDIMFLDVQMPAMDGFELLERLPAPLPVVIFVTAYDTHAVQAFEAQALDYLLKPFKVARFRAALARARDQLARGVATQHPARSSPDAEPARNEKLARVAVRDSGRVRFIKTADIDWIEASGNYVVLHVGKEKHVLRETLSAFEQQLSPREFTRISRSAIVNLDRVQHIEPTFAHEHIVVLADGTRLDLTRGLRELHERLKFG